MKPVYCRGREPIKSRLFGNGKMLCWETMVEQAVERYPHFGELTL